MLFAAHTVVIIAEWHGKSKPKSQDFSCPGVSAAQGRKLPSALCLAVHQSLPVHT